VTLRHQIGGQSVTCSCATGRHAKWNTSWQASRAGNWGLLGLDQLRAHLSDRQIERRVGSRQLEIVRTAVYRVVGTPQSWDQALLAACLAGGANAAASHRSAAWWWRLGGFDPPDMLEITVPRHRRVRMTGVSVHQTTVWGVRHFTRSGPLPVSTPARTLCDSTGFCSPKQVERAVDDALRRRLTTLRMLTSVFIDLACRGRRRSTTMRAILDDRLTGFHPGDSHPEVRLAKWLRSAGLPPAVQQHQVRVGGRSYRMDLAYPAEKIDIEYDGWEAHRPRSAFDNDRDRDMRLELEGWLVLRFTSRHGRATVVERVARAIVNRSK
jgi:very-short-patch-repair endonuclease